MLAPGSCPGTYTINRTWKATDIYGNSSTCVQAITVQDISVPSFTVPTNIEIFTDATCAYNADPSVTGDVTDEADNCDITLNATYNDVTVDGPCAGSKVITRTWTLTDDCNNTTTHVQTITVSDNTAPTFTVPANIEIFTDATCAYNADPSVTGDVTDEADNCDITLNATYNDVTVDGPCAGSKVITRTWTLTDDCNNTTTHVQTITVSDNTAPTFTVPANIEIFTDATCAYNADPSVTGDVTDEADNCDITLNATYNDVTVDGPCAGSKVITRTWTLTDDCNNTTTHVQTITVSDNTAPTFTVPANIEIFTDATCAYNADPSVTGDVTDEADNCDITLNATYNDVTVDGPCAGSKVITRTWTLTDDCNNTTTHVQTITVSDNTAPTFTVPANIEIFTDATCAYNADPSVTGDVTDEADNCDITLNATYNDVTVDGPCAGSKVITRTWTLTDDCNNTTTHVQTITVSDNTAPTFTVPANIEIFTDATCAYNADPSVTGDVTDEADNCDITLNATYNDVTVDGPCAGSKVITRTWTLTDDCNNTTTHVQTITVSDNTAPTFTVPANIEIFTDATCAYNADPSVTGDVTDEADNCDITLNATYNDVTVDGPCAGSKVITRTWTLTDDCNNTTTHVQTITVSDNTAPTFTVPANIEIFTDATCAYNADPSVTGDVTDEADNCDITLNATYNDVTVDGPCAGSKVITRTWTLTDDCNNTTTHVQTITVSDNTAPTFTVPANIEIFTDATCAYNADPSVTGDVTDEADNCDITLNATYNDVTVDGPCAGSKVITRTWTLTDDCNNTTTHVQTITVSDNIAPVITTVDGSLDAVLECSNTSGITAALAAEPAATDNCDLTLTATLTSDVTTPGSCPQAYIRVRKWTISDDCGNVSTEFTQTITVSDNTAPTFTVPANIEIFTDATCAYNADPSVTGDVTDEADNCDITLNATYNDVTVDGPCAGSKVITRTWTLTDDCNNTTTHVQTITVSDNTAPTFTVPANIEIFTDATCAYNADPSVTGDVTDEADNCDITLNATYNDVTVDGPCAGSKVITRTWTLTDDCNNTTTHVQTITVSDNTAPTFTVPANIEIFTDATCAYNADPSVTGDVTDEADNCDITLNATYNDVTVDGPCAGSKVITRTWTLTDDCNNTTTHVQTITVSDNTAPTFTVPANIEIFTDATCAYNADPSVTGDVTDEADNCDITLNATYNDVTVDGPCAGSKVITRTWTLTDDCNNTTTHVQTITVSDNTAPTFTVPANIEIFTDATCAYNADPSVTGDVTDEADNCDITLNATYNDVTVDGPCAGSKVITRTWTLTDDCNNTTTHVQTITVSDNTAPTFTVPANIEIFTDATCAYNADPSVTGDVTDEADNCDITLNATYNDVTVDGPCAGSKVITRTWTLTDDCNNTTTHVQTITVSDNTAPTVITQNITVNLDANGQVTISDDAVDNGSTDNCSTVLTFSLSQTTFTCSEVGDNIVTLTVTDECGNSSFSTATVTVKDITPPAIINLPASFSINALSNNCNALVSWTAPSATDNCGVLNLTSSDAFYNQFGFSLLGVGVHTITYTAADVNGNTTTASFTITVVDNQPPTITGCLPNIIVSASSGACSAVVTYLQPVPSDNCSGVSLAINNNAYLPGSTIPVGVHTVIYTATDASGNTAVCSFTITVEDNTAPVITCPSDITVSNDAGQCGAVVTYPAATATDNCAGTPSITYSIASGSTFPVGTTTVTVTATDAVGNTSSCSFTVTVNDTEAPVAVCPPNLIVANDLGQCGAIVTFTGLANDNCPGATIQFTPASGSFFPVGTTTVTAIATDASGNTSACSFTVKVEDDEAPVAMCPANIEQNNDPGQCGALVTFSAAANDNCPGATVSYSHTSGSFFPVGTTPVTITAIDAVGNTSSCTFNVIIKDTEAPVITCPADITVGNDPGQCGADVSFAASATDNCTASPSLDYSIASGSFFAAGTTTTVTVIATDASGNTSACTFTVTVNDTEGPVVTCPAAITASNDAGLCSAVVSYPAATATDNCAGTPTLSYSHASGSTFPVGTTTVTVTATDAVGNTSACTFTVTVNDTEDPVVNCPLDIEVSNDAGLCSAVVNYPAATATDNCAGTPSLSYSHSSGSAFPVGTTTVTVTATDAAGNTSACTFTITVNDTEAPVVNCPLDIQASNDAGLCSAVVNYPAATATDNCAGTPSLSYSHSSGSSFPVGTTTVTVTATDAAGNTSACTFTITVNDTEDPVVTCPAAIAVNNDAGLCGAVVNYPAATATDNCAGTPSLSYSHASGSTFPVGTTTVTVTATDAAGNTSACTFTVTVNDTEDPVVTCPANITTVNDPGQCGAAVSFTASLTDNCPGATVSYFPASGSVFPIGTTLVTATATDAAGNTSSCTFSVTVEDDELPAINCPGNILVNNDAGLCGAVVTFSVAVNDNCTATLVLSHESGDFFPIGVTTVIATATDASGNTTTCSFTVTVEDNTVPLIACPSNIAVSNDPGACGAIVNFEATASDNCVGGATVTYSQNPGTLFPIGQTIVTVTAIDGNGNTASCSFTVTVTDDENPVITCPANINVNNDAGQCGAVVTYNATISDNCPGASVSYSLASGSVFPIGTTMVTATATDAAGNTSSCTFTVTVNDNQAPVIVCPANISVGNTAGQCGATVSFIATVTDNCAGATVSYSPASGSFFPVGTTTVTATATDANGNTSACSFTVTVNDTEDPVITCPANVSVNNQAGQCGAIITFALATATDNCTGITCHYV